MGPVSPLVLCDCPALWADEAAVAADRFKREDATVLRQTVLRQHPSSRATLVSEDIR